MNNICKQLIQRNECYTLIILYTIGELLNIVLKDSSLNLIVSGPQILVVFCYIFIRVNYRKAFLLHMIFFALSFNSTSALLDFNLFSYGKIKLVGPITLSYLIGGLIWLNVLRSRIVNKNTLIYHTRNLIKGLMIGGTIIGCLGLLLWDYPIHYFMRAFVYILVGYVHVDTFIRLMDKQLSYNFYRNAFYLIISSLFASFISFNIFGITSKYSTEEAFIYNEMFVFIPCLIIAIVHPVSFQLKKVIGITLLLYYAWCLVIAGRGGMFLVTFVSLIIAMIIYCKSTSSPIKTFFRILLISIVAIVVVVIVSNATMSQLSTIKFNQFLSLGNLFLFSGDFIENVKLLPTSPYVRVSEILNLLHNGLDNFFGLLFGKGYGGHFVDSLNMFYYDEVFRGGYSDDVVVSGKFTTAHGAIPSGLLYNGLLGTYFMIKVGVKYLMRCKYTCLCMAGPILFIYGFYYNPLIMTASLFLLFGSEYVLTYSQQCTK